MKCCIFNDKRYHHIILDLSYIIAANVCIFLLGFDVSSTSHIFHKLMRRLEFSQYYVQGGDWGSVITTIIAQAYPE